MHTYDNLSICGTSSVWLGPEEEFAYKCLHTVSTSYVCFLSLHKKAYHGITILKNLICFYYVTYDAQHQFNECHYSKHVLNMLNVDIVDAYISAKLQHKQCLVIKCKSYTEKMPRSIVYHNIIVIIKKWKQFVFQVEDWANVRLIQYTSIAWYTSVYYFILIKNCFPSIVNAQCCICNLPWCLLAPQRLKDELGIQTNAFFQSQYLPFQLSEENR